MEEAFALARSLGIPNLLQPGLAKELVIADLLGHQLTPEKKGVDARDREDPNLAYEYLSFLEGKSGQFDRMIQYPEDKRRDSLDRIRRNHKIYFAVFYKKNQIKVKTIYEVEPNVVLAEVIRKLDRSSNRISHVNLPESWARANGRVVYRNPESAEAE